MRFFFFTFVSFEISVTDFHVGYVMREPYSQSFYSFVVTKHTSADNNQTEDQSEKKNASLSCSAFCLDSLAFIQQSIFVGWMIAHVTHAVQSTCRIRYVPPDKMPNSDFIVMWNVDDRVKFIHSIPLIN